MNYSINFMQNKYPYNKEITFIIFKVNLHVETKFTVKVDSLHENEIMQAFLNEVCCREV